MKKSGDTRSLIHRIINLLWSTCALGLAGAITFYLLGYEGWDGILVVFVLLLLPIVSDIIAIVIASVRYTRRRQAVTLLGLIFSIAAIPLYWFIRIVLKYDLVMYLMYLLE